MIKTERFCWNHTRTKILGLQAPGRLFLSSSIVFLFVNIAVAAGTTFETLVLFNGTNGQDPNSLIQGTNGDFYGATSYGGVGYTTASSPSGFGTIFQMTPSGTLTTLHSFTGDSNGANPFVTLVQGSDGYFYGATPLTYNPINYGTIFKMSSSGTLTRLCTFNQANGSYPYGLLQSADGNFYGTTTYGGLGYTFGDNTSGYGTVFKMTPSGTLTNIYLFNDFEYGPNRLVQGRDGYLYGTTFSGNGFGSVVKITPTGFFANLASFNGDNGHSANGLVQGPGDKFFGVTRYGGGTSFGFGNIFVMTSSGVWAPLHYFNGSDGMFPSGALVVGRDGNLYGTTRQGGSTLGRGAAGRGYGTVFRLIPIVNGTLTTLYSFTNGLDGAYPDAGVVQGTDGSFYGTTSAGGLNGVNGGTVFRVSGPPELNSVTKSANNSIQLSFNVSLGQTNILQASTNLVDWINLIIYSPTNGTFLFSDTNILRCRFYRLFLP